MPLPLSWTTMATTMVLHDASRVHLEACCAKPADYVEHTYVVFYLGNDKPRSKPTRKSSKKLSAYVETLS